MDYPHFRLGNKFAAQPCGGQRPQQGLVWLPFFSHGKKVMRPSATRHAIFAEGAPKRMFKNMQQAQFRDTLRLLTDMLGIRAKLTRMQDINLQLPIALTWLYQIKSAYDTAKPSNKLFVHHDRLTRRYELDFGQVLPVFLIENQGNWQCKLDLKKDPCTVIFDDFTEQTRIATTIEEILATFTLQELAFELPYLCEVDWTAEQLKSEFAGLKIINQAAQYVPQGSVYQFFGLDRKVLFMSANGTTFVASNDAQAFQNCRAALTKT
jgi:hypothetical protein